MQLVWHVKGTGVEQADVGPAYRLDKDYRPVEVWARRNDPGEPVTSLETGKRINIQVFFDINDDDSSIFADGRPFFRHGEQEMNYFHFAKLNEARVMNEHSVITLDFDDAVGENLTIILTLEEV